MSEPRRELPPGVNPDLRKQALFNEVLKKVAVGGTPSGEDPELVIAAAADAEVDPETEIEAEAELELDAEPEAEGAAVVEPAEPVQPPAIKKAPPKTKAKPRGRPRK